jgi:hypothetical protein
LLPPPQRLGLGLSFALGRGHTRFGRRCRLGRRTFRAPNLERDPLEAHILMAASPCSPEDHRGINASST